MAPYVFNIENAGGVVTVNALDFSGDYFTFDAELPASVSSTRPLPVAVSTGTAEEGLVEDTMAIIYSGDRDVELHPITAYAYDPVDGDVWENAIELTEFPYNEAAPTGIYQNYELPEIAETANDAVYEVTFDSPKLLSASTTGADGIAYVYTEDFEGVGGPSDDNYYEYNGPEVGPGPINMWFSYNYTGTNTWYGSSAGGGMIFGYRITPAMLQELGLGNCAITTVEAAAREGSYYDLMILKGGDTPDINNMVYYQEFDAYTPYYFFDVNLDELQFLGDDENIWVMFYSDSPYAAYCGIQPVDAANSKIWYTTNLTDWYSSTTYTPVIYTRFLELPTGREVTVNLADMTIRESQPAAGELAEANGDVMGVAKAQMQKANRGNREAGLVDEMYVPAGTYYVAMASSDVNFPVSIDAVDAPAPVQAIVSAPYDGETYVAYPYVAEWILGDYTEEMQVLYGLVYPPTTPLIDWTSDLVETAVLPELQNNKTYFLQVNERNAVGTTYGEIVGFTTPIDMVEGFTAESTELYPGESAVFTWDANHSIKGYNIYQDGVKLNENLITTTTYTVEGLEYNMTNGYTFNVTAVYDEGESFFSNDVVVYMTGTGFVNGHVWEYDSITPVYNVQIALEGTDEYGHEQVLYLEGTTNPSGYYTGEALAGNWQAVGYKDAYQPSYSEEFAINYTETTDDIDVILLEDWAPLQMIKATEEENDVLVEWSWEPAEMIVDFETGDFTQAEFTLPAQYPWTITTTNPYEGTYCMKSTCEGIASGTSSIEATVDVPYEGKMGFWVRVSSESNYDKFHFYIDGVEQGQAMSGQLAYAYKEYSVTEGTHTYKWEYAKDSSVNSNDDCVYVDYITMYRQDVPVPPTPGAQTYDFEDMTMQGWTAIDGGSPAGYGWQLVSDKIGTGYGHNASTDAVLSQSYDNNYGVVYPDNYLVAPARIAAQNGAAISFYACAQDGSYAAEHFGVAVSTGNATAAEFTTIQEWTMTAKGSANNADEAKSEIRGTREQGSWYQYTVDLSSYAGQQIWVAIRHFNCSDQFYLLVDDITLADGSAKRGGNDRTMSNYVLYRRNNYGDTVVEQIATPAIDVMSYVDTQWPTLDFGEYQWGIQAYYEGNHHYPEKGRSTWFDDFEDGALSNWTTIDADGDGDTWQNGTPASYGIGDAYSGTNCACSWSWNSYTMYPDNYMISPLCDGATNVTYYVATNTAYPDHYGVYASSTGTNASDFTLVFEETAGSKGGNGTRSSMTQAGTRDMSDWMAKNVDLPAGTKYVAFRHWNSDDMNYLFIDDVTITMNGGGGGGTAGTLVIDFETGDFSQYDFVNDATYPWTIVTDNSSYVMKSSNSGVASSESAISATVEYVADGTVSFDALCMGEGTSTAWDKCIFEIDGAQQFAYGANVAGWNNYSFPVTAGTHTFTWKYTKDSSVNPEGDYMEVDNITFDGVAGGGGGGGDIPEGFGYSDIIWSNIIEKDMTADVVFNVSLNNGQSPIGAAIAMVGEQTYNGTVDEFGICEFPAVRKGNYDITVTLAGYDDVVMIGEVIEENEIEFDVTLVEQIAPVAELYVSPTGWVMWEGGSAPGPGPQPGGDETFTEGFEGGLNGWNVLTVNTGEGEWIHSDDNLGGYDYTELAHTGTGFAMCYSFVDNVGPYDTDSYLYTPQKYSIVNGSTLTFWADNANDDYPEDFSVCVATADNPTAADFTQVWSGGAKGTGNGGAAMRHQDNRYQNWRSHSIDLSAYAGQQVYIAFHDVNQDMYEIWIDDVELAVANKGNRTALNYIVMLDGQVQGDTEMPFFQHDVEGLEAGSEHITKVRAVYTGGNSDWAEYTWTYTPCDNYTGMQSYNITADGSNVTVSFVLPEGGQPTPPTPPTPGTGEWYYYDNGVNVDAIGTGGSNFYWGVMFPAGSYTGTMVTKTAMYDYMAMTGNVTIYNDGTTAPANAVGTANVTMTGSEDFVETEFAEPVVIDPTKNLWIVYYNGSGATYPASVCANTGDANGRWVSLDGSTWEDLAGYDLNYTFMVRAYVATGAKGEVVEISAPQGTPGNGTFANAGVAKAHRSNRDMWDFLGYFEAAEGGHYGVASDGEYFYTSNWGYSAAAHNFYKYELDGTVVEGFDIAGCGTLRGMTYDGQYFYGVANSSTIYCVDLANHTLVGTTTSAYGAMRAITYDPVRDGFWVVGNWSGNLTLIDRTGAIVQAGPAPTNAADCAYYMDPDGVEHVYCFNNGTNDVDDYNIATNTITTAVFNVSGSAITGSAGGCFVGTYDNKTCFFADVQQSPNYIAIYELDGEAPVPPTPPTPPTPTGDVLGAFIFVDGELITYEPVTTSPYTFSIDFPGEYEVCVRVVYSDYAMSCYECETVVIGEVTCDPVTDLTAVPYEYNGNNGALVSFTEPAGAVAYNIYVEGELLGSLSAQPIFINFEGAPDGEYLIGIVAVYDDCESDMETVVFGWDAVEENAVVSAIYPNPTSGDLHINATAMTRVSVYNTVGQMVYDQTVNCDEMVLDMSQFEAGVYMVNVVTENGTSVKRITVVK